MTERLAVLLSGHLVGHLERPGDRTDPTFAYTRDYVLHGEVALSAQLPVRSATFDERKVRSYLVGLLPESEDARAAWADRLGVAADDAFGILAEMGRDCPGAVQFCPEDQIDELRARAGEHEPVTASEIADRIRALAGPERSWTMPGEHWSLGGQQEKFALARLGDQWHTAHGSAATTHIVKPGIRVLHHQALVEHVTMAAARNVNVSVAASAFVRFEDQWAIVVDRFDRTIVDSRVVRIHQEDFAQACGRMPANKYESRGGPRLADMARIVTRESTELVDDRIALADFLAINVVAGAPDGHAKNISLLRAPRLTAVAPLYDLATGLAYDSRNVDRSVALSVGGERAVTRIRRRQWEKAAATLRIDPALLIRRVADLARRFPAAFEAELEMLSDVVPGVDEVHGRTMPGLTKQADAVLDGL